MGFWQPNVEELEKALAEAKKRDEETKASKAAKGKGSFTRKDLKTHTISVGKLPVGKYRFRLLPNFRAPEHPLYAKVLPFVKCNMYYSIPPGKGACRNLTAMYPEELKSRGLTDPMNDAVRRLFAEGFVTKMQDFGVFPNQMPSKSEEFYTNVLWRADEGKEVLTPKLLQLKTKNAQDLMERVMDKIRDGKNIYDPEKGRDIILKKSMVDGKQNVTFDWVDDPSPVVPGNDKVELDRILSEQFNLDLIYGFPKEEALVKMEGLAQGLYEYYAAKTTNQEPPESAVISEQVATAKSRKRKGHTDEKLSDVDALFAGAETSGDGTTDDLPY